MSWITQQEAQNASGITISDFDSAGQFVAWAVTNGWCSRLQDDKELVTLYENSTMKLTQNVETTVYEFRALDQNFATFLARLMTDDTTKLWTYYAIDDKGDIHTVQVPEYFESESASVSYYDPLISYTSGGSQYYGQNQTITTKVPKLKKNVNGQERDTIPYKYTGTAVRDNDADGWRVTLTYRKYDHIPRDQTSARPGGFVPTPPNSAKLGVVVSTVHSKQYVATDLNGYNVFQEENTTTKEYKYLTKQEADTIRANQAASNSRLYIVRLVVSWSTQGGNVYKDISVRGGSAWGAGATDKTPVSTT